ncbi:MAG: transporter substrate-binding domain-containing protein [Anaerostipes sp.]|nr:transporter substrate-binding domain-containing protein [Anaerostipes sp.]
MLTGKICKAAHEKTVRVGIFSLGKFMSFDKNGKAQGYNVDYLDNIAKKNHWKYEYVDCSNWVKATEMLKNGKIDLLAPAQRIDSLVKNFDFATNSMGIEAAAIYTNGDRNDLSYEDFDKMKNLTYGVVKVSTFADKFKSEYVKEHGLSPKIKEYNDTTELMSALNEKKVDAIVTNIMFYSDNLKMLGWFNTLQVYYIAQKGNQDLLNDIDSAMVQIMVKEPSFQAELESKYFPVFINTQLTYEEQQYVKKLPVITVGYVQNNTPISYKDSKTGEFKGMTRDILDTISKNTGIKFKYVALPQRDVTVEYLKEHKIYVVSNAEANDTNSSLEKLHLSVPYLSSEKVLISKNELKFTSKSKLHVGIATGSQTMKEVILSEYPNFKISVYDSAEDCFEAVKTGKIAATIQNRYVGDHILENPLYSDLTVSSARLLSNQLSIATVDVNPNDSTCSLVNDNLFISIMDRGIQRISTEKLNKIIIKNTSNSHYKYSISDIIKKYSTVIMTIGFLVLICITLLIVIQRITKKKNKELEKKNDLLADAVAQADRANDAKSQFLSSMSHEIRTPMNAIVGLTNIAKKHKRDPEKIDDYLTKIDVSSKVLLNIINDVLDMSAIESNKLKIDKTEFDMKQVLEGISTIYYPQCRNKGIKFKMAIDMENEILIGDSLRVNQILMNLVSNAYKFTDSDGTIHIIVKEIERREKETFIRFTVSDTGCGMSMKMRERIFQPFEQESAATAKAYGGSGLGLSIAKNLVDIMHGAISVESEKGVGTTFQVDLPFQITGDTTIGEAKELKRIRILVADDDQASREYVSIVLKRLGVKFDIAACGQEAIKRFNEVKESNHPYDVCLLDWKMPDLTGIEVTQMIRKDEKEKAAIIIVSSYDLNEVEDSAKEAGADYFVSKPLFQSTVFNILMSLSKGQLKKENASPDQYDFTGHKVLLAEDNEMNSEIATELLHMVNLEVDRAENGQKAVELFEKSESGTYGAILMDVQMPVLDGYEATRKIRGLDRDDAKEIPIYAMTANAFTEDVSTAFSVGMNGHIGKPIDTQVLYDTLAKVMKVKM